MQKQVLISGAGFAGLTLAYWLNKYGCKVTVIEMAKDLRKEGAPIDVRGEALNVAKEMGILEKIRAREFVQGSEIEIVNAKNETIHTFSINAQPEYLGDIEIQRKDLLDILYDNIPANEVEFLFNNRIERLVQHEEQVEVTFKNAESRDFDLVFGADGTHSSVRQLVFGDEESFSQFFGEYFAFVDTPGIQAKPNTRMMYNEPGTMAMITRFNNSVNAGLIWRSPKLHYDYKNHEEHKQILKEKFANNTNWRIPEILDATLHAHNVYFDEVCQIHMPSWTHGRVALLGDAAHAASFHTGMGTSLAMQGATILAKELHSNDDYRTAFAKYYEQYKPYAESIQSRITRGMNYLVPETEEGIREAYNRFEK